MTVPVEQWESWIRGGPSPGSADDVPGGVGWLGPRPKQRKR